MNTQIYILTFFKNTEKFNCIWHNFIVKADRQQPVLISSSTRSQTAIQNTYQNTSPIVYIINNSGNSVCNIQPTANSIIKKQKKRKSSGTRKNRKTTVIERVIQPSDTTTTQTTFTQQTPNGSVEGDEVILDSSTTLIPPFSIPVPETQPTNETLSTSAGEPVFLLDSEFTAEQLLDLKIYPFGDNEQILPSETNEQLHPDSPQEPPTNDEEIWLEIESGLGFR